MQCILASDEEPSDMLAYLWQVLWNLRPSDAFETICLVKTVLSSKYASFRSIIPKAGVMEIEFWQQVYDEMKRLFIFGLFEKHLPIK